MLGFGIPVAFYIWFLHHYTLNVVHADQWSDVTLIGASYQGHFTLAALWAQHNENRLLFPNLIVLAMSRLDAFNVSAEEYLSAVFLLAAVALIIGAHKRRAPERPWIVYCPVVILMLSVVQAQNTLWGFQLAWYMVLFTLAGVIFLLDRPRCPRSASSAPCCLPSWGATPPSRGCSSGSQACCSSSTGVDRHTSWPSGSREER